MSFFPLILPCIEDSVMKLKSTHRFNVIQEVSYNPWSRRKKFNLLNRSVTWRSRDDTALLCLHAMSEAAWKAQTGWAAGACVLCTGVHWCAPAARPLLRGMSAGTRAKKEAMYTNLCYMMLTFMASGAYFRENVFRDLWLQFFDLLMYNNESTAFNVKKFWKLQKNTDFCQHL